GVNSVAFSPCGRQIASASYDCTIRLWSSETGECLFILNGHRGAVWSAAYSADGRRLVSGSLDGTIRVWDPETATPEPGWVISHFGGSRVTLFAHGRVFALTAGLGGSEIRLVDAVTGEQGLILGDDIDRLTDIAVSPIGELIVSSSWDNTIRLWDSSNGQLISRMSGHRDQIASCTFSPDGLQIASGDENGIVRLWEVNTNRSSSITQKRAAEVRTVVYSPDGLSIISNHIDNTIQRWDSSSGASRSIPLPFSHRTFAPRVYLVASSPNGHWVASAFCQWLALCDCGGLTRLWDLNRPYDQGKVVGELDDLSHPRRYVVFSPLGDQFAVGSETVSVYGPPRLRLFDPRSTDFRKPLKEPFISDMPHSMGYSQDGQRLVLGTKASSVLIWDLGFDEPNFKLEGHTDEVNSVACSPCGKWILSGSRDKTARLWSGETDSWSCVAVVGGCFEAMTSASWNPVVPLEFVTGSSDGSVRVWRISVAEAGDVSVRMHWGSHIGQMCATDLTFKGAVGLSPIYRKLLVQRGAIDDSLLSE
ncbi:hypothetical protein BGZ88_005377, partial [Linnemannia elongata]